MRRWLLLIIIMSGFVPALCHDESALETRYAFEAILLAVFAFMVLLYAGHERRAHEREALYAERMESSRRQLDLMSKMLMQRLDFARLLDSLQSGAANRYKMQEEDWRELEQFLDVTQNLFVHRLREQFPHLSEDDLRLLMLLRLRMPAKVLADIYGIAEKSVKQNLFLFKKKVGLEGRSQSLRTFVEQY